MWNELGRNVVAGFARQLPRLLVAAIVFFLVFGRLERLEPPGWDEATHAGLGGAELWTKLRLPDPLAYLHAALSMQQYPPGYPAWLSLVFLATGPTVLAGRALTLFSLCMLSVLAAALADHLVGSRRPTRAGWVTQGLVLSSPLCVHFGRTLFLEVPFTTLAVFFALLYVKLERRELEALPPGRPRATWIYLWPGFFLAGAFFIKWNYGVLLLGVVLLERAASLWQRRGERLRSLAASTFLLAPLGLACAWWFLLPYPARAFEVAAQNRAAFAAYLTSPRAPGASWQALALYLGWFVHLSPLVAACAWVCALLSLRFVRRAGARLVWLAGAAFVGAVITHDFKLARFLIPGIVFTWVLVGAGAFVLTARMTPGRRAFATLCAGLLFLLSASPWALTPQRLGVLDQDVPVLAKWRDPYASDWIPTPAARGVQELASRAADQLAQPRSVRLRVLRTSQVEMPPATLLWLLGEELWRRGSPLAASFLRLRRIDDLDVGFFGRVPAGWSEDLALAERELHDFLDQSDMVVLLDPGYARGQAFRHEPLAASEWIVNEARRYLDRSADFMPAQQEGPLRGATFECWFSERMPQVSVSLYERVVR